MEIADLKAKMDLMIQRSLQQELISKQHIAKLEKEEMRHQLQESECSKLLRQSSEAIAAMTRDGGLFTIRMNEELSNARSEAMVEKVTAVDTKVSLEKINVL